MPLSVVLPSVSTALPETTSILLTFFASPSTSKAIVCPAEAEAKEYSPVTRLSINFDRERPVFSTMLSRLLTASTVSETPTCFLSIMVVLLVATLRFLRAISCLLLMPRW